MMIMIIIIVIIILFKYKNSLIVLKGPLWHRGRLYLGRVLLLLLLIPLFDPVFVLKNALKPVLAIEVLNAIIAVNAFILPAV